MVAVGMFSSGVRDPLRPASRMRRLLLRAVGVGSVDQGHAELDGPATRMVSSWSLGSSQAPDPRESRGRVGRRRWSSPVH
jgi:hypothetical protein